MIPRIQQKKKKKKKTKTNKKKKPHALLLLLLLLLPGRSNRKKKLFRKTNQKIVGDCVCSHGDDAFSVNRIGKKSSLRKLFNSKPYSSSLFKEYTEFETVRMNRICVVIVMTIAKKRIALER